MKKLYTLLFAFLITTYSFGQVLANDDFAYSDGSLVGNGGWANHSGTVGDLLVSSGQAVVQHGVPSEDANLAFAPVAGNIYYGINFSVDDLGAPYTAGGDYEYFAHFKDGTFGFRGRLDVVPPTGGGDFTVGIATLGGTADATWATDLTFGVTYRAVVRYDQDNNIAELWIDASGSGDTSILGADEADPGDSMVGFALRQSDSSENETVRVDNLVVAQTFDEANNPSLTTNDFNKSDFKIYPNPNSTGTLNISSLSGQQTQVAIYDMLGKQVIRTETTQSVNIAQLNAGLYMVKLTQGSSSVTKKLVVQ